MVHIDIVCIGKSHIILFIDKMGGEGWRIVGVQLRIDLSSKICDRNAFLPNVNRYMKSCHVVCIGMVHIILFY
jgi:hypothetical protein